MLGSSEFGEFFYGGEANRGVSDPALQRLCRDLDAEMTITTVEDPARRGKWCAEVVVTWEAEGVDRRKISGEIAVNVAQLDDRVAARDAAYVTMRETVDGLLGSWAAARHDAV